MLFSSDLSFRRFKIQVHHGKIGLCGVSKNKFYAFIVTCLIDFTCYLFHSKLNAWVHPSKNILTCYSCRIITSHCTIFFFPQITCFSVQFALPHLMGWDRLTNQLPRSSTESSSSSKVDQQFLDLEWDKWTQCLASFADS